MRPKSGLPKRRAIRATPRYTFGFRSNPATALHRHPSMDGAPRADDISVMSLFCGCGGMDLGFMGGFAFLGELFPALGFRIVEAVDIDARSIETYRLNIGDHCRIADLTKVSPGSLPAARVLIGGFPCQDFSSSGPKVGLSGSRGSLYQVMAAYMMAHRPEIVVAENVPHLQRLKGGDYLRKILRDFESCGYVFDVWELYGPDYGLPQSRRRLFLMGKRDDIAGNPVCPRPTHKSAYVTVDRALDDLVTVTDESVTNQSQYFVATRATAGGGQGDHVNRRGEPAYCIRANAKARIQFHYQLDRRLTVRECARLQSFPDEFVFPFAAMSAMEQIGNAVPPLLGHRVARSILEFMHASAEPNAATTRAARHLQRQSELSF
jgi:DNA (cytosine-5)-methyltransferase 1